MRRRGQNSVLPYLLLNVIVSAATVLAVLLIWERVRQSDVPPTPMASLPAPIASPTTDPTEAFVPEPTATPALPAGTLIEITAVIGATDPQQEYVQLKHLGEGDLSLAGWQLKDEDGNVFTFPSNPELILYKDGAVQVYTRIGNDTPAELFWNRSAAVWRPGEQVTLVDTQGTVQATAQVP